MTKPDTYYDNCPLRRTLEELYECALKSKEENYCCVAVLLCSSTIPLNHIILDELHLMLQVTDVLIGNIVEDVIHWDDKFSNSNWEEKNPS